MKILILTQFFPPDITAAAFRLGDTANLLAQNGHEVKVLAGIPHKGEVKTDDENGGIDTKVDVLRCQINPLNGQGIKAYLAHYLSFVKSSSARGFRLWRTGWKPDVVFVTSPPLFVGIGGRFLSFLFRRPMVFEVRDIWPDTAVAAGQLSADGKGYKVGRLLERYLYRKAKHIVCVAEPMKGYLQSQCKKPVDVVYNGISKSDVPAFQPSPQQSDQTRTLLYAGNFGHLQDLELLVDAFIEAVRSQKLERFQLRLIGDGVRRSQLEQLVKDREAASLVTIESAMPRDQAYAEMQAATVLYLSLRNSPVLEHTIPSKVFDYLAMGRPVIAALQGEGRSILQSTGSNLCLNPCDRDGLIETLGQLNQQLDELQNNAEKNRDLVLEKFTREIAVKNLESVFEKAQT